MKIARQLAGMPESHSDGPNRPIRKLVPIAALAALGLLVWADGRCAESRGCPPPGYSRSRLEELKSKKGDLTGDSARNALAVSLTACLASPDPELRDAIAFELLSRYLRAGQLSGETMLAIERQLVPWLAREDSAGFRRPFAALVLSEIARADRIKPYMTPEMRSGLLAAAADYFRSVRDYRGFDEHDGWRHGVAHGADLLLQLSLNPALGRPEMNRILAALETQIAPRGHFYIYGEPQRMARPVLAIAERGLITEAEWTEWLSRVSAPAPLPNWEDAFSSQIGLARVHDIREFISEIYIAARSSSDAGVATLLPGVEKAIGSIP